MDERTPRLDMEVLTLDAGGDANRTYLILPGGRAEAWCVDPSFGERAIAETCRQRNRPLAHVLLTHTHSDHTAGVAALRAAFGCKVWCHPEEMRRVPGAEPVPDEGPLPGLLEVEALFTPGHTPGSTCYRVDGHLFTGDTLFVDWVGRADFSGGDAGALFHSLGLLRALPGHLVLHPGHDYGAVPSRTLAEEIRHNRFLACTDYPKFLALLPELAD